MKLFKKTTEITGRVTIFTDFGDQIQIRLERSLSNHPLCFTEFLNNFLNRISKNEYEVYQMKRVKISFTDIHHFMLLNYSISIFNRNPHLLF